MKKESVEKRLLDRMKRFTEDLKSGVEIEKKYKVRKVKLQTAKKVSLQIDTVIFNGPQVREVRELLNISQPLFADFLGVSSSAVKSWERGASAPSGLAARVMTWIKDDPKYFRQHLQQVTIQDAPAPKRRKKATV